MKIKQSSLSFKNKKKGRILSAFFFIFLFSVSAQNLVPNNCFETFSTCPNNISQINYATGWVNAAPQTSPDYFNSCASLATGMNVPTNIFSYQPDCCGGNGYAGMYVFNKISPNNGRDYIQIKLSDTLTAGKKYLAGMSVNNVDYFDYAIGSMGMYFTSTAIQAPAGVGFINVPNPQVKNTTPLTDTLNWMLVQDTITGTGTELYLTIGNFSSDSLCDTIRTNYGFNGGYGYSPYAYYYIDNVFVIDAAFAGIKENSEKIEVNIFPNPASEILNVMFKFKNGARIQIKDLAGRIVSEMRVENTKGKTSQQINISVLSKGIYFLNLFNGEKIYSEKFIKE